MLKPIPRRTLLRGLLGGVAVGLALPTLEVFLDKHGEALAGGDAFPARFGLWFWGNGIGPDPANWVPTGTGTSYTLSPILAPLAPVQADITVVSGLKVLTPNTDPHGTGPAGVLTGARVGPNGTNARIIDQIIADQIAGTHRRTTRSRCRSIPSPTRRPRTASRASRTLPRPAPRPSSTPCSAPPSARPAPMVPVDPKLGLRQSVLLHAVAGADAKALRVRLGVGRPAAARPAHDQRPRPRAEDRQPPGHAPRPRRVPHARGAHGGVPRRRRPPAAQRRQPRDERRARPVARLRSAKGLHVPVQPPGEQPALPGHEHGTPPAHARRARRATDGAEHPPPDPHRGDLLHPGAEEGARGQVHPPRPLRRALHDRTAPTANRTPSTSTRSSSPVPRTEPCRRASTTAPVGARTRASSG